MHFVLRCSEPCSKFEFNARIDGYAAVSGLREHPERGRSRVEMPHHVCPVLPLDQRRRLGQERMDRVDVGGENRSFGSRVRGG